MAMRGTSRSSDVRPRVTVRPVYEDFKPMTEWKQDESSDVLLVYLPGFMKEYLKVTIEGRNTVRIRGERLVVSNKWSRFQEDYQVPDHCTATGIRAKFEHGILTVTMPRKNIVPRVEVIPKIEPKTTHQALSPQGATTKPGPQKTTNQEEKGHKSHPSPKKGDQEFVPPRPQNVTSDQKSQYGIESSNAIKKKEEISEPKGKPREMSPKVMEKSTREEKERERERERENKSGEKGKEAIKDENVVKRKENSEIERPQNAKVEEGKKSEGGNVVERKIEKVGNYLEGKLKEASTSENEYFGESKLEYYYKKVMMAKNEERQLLVNMGVAVLVIVALGAYVSYTTFGSSRAKH